MHVHKCVLASGLVCGSGHLIPAMTMCACVCAHVCAHLYACACVFSTQAAGQGPPAGGDEGHLGDGLHPLRAAYTHLEEGTTHVKYYRPHYVTLTT